MRCSRLRTLSPLFTVFRDRADLAKLKPWANMSGPRRLPSAGAPSFAPRDLPLARRRMGRTLATATRETGRRYEAHASFAAERGTPHERTSSCARCATPTCDPVRSQRDPSRSAWRSPRATRRVAWARSAPTRQHPRTSSSTASRRQRPSFVSDDWRGSLLIDRAVGQDRASALSRFLEVLSHAALYAVVARQQLRLRRVLEKCGFRPHRDQGAFTWSRPPRR